MNREKKYLKILNQYKKNEIAHSRLYVDENFETDNPITKSIFFCSVKAIFHYIPPEPSGFMYPGYPSEIDLLAVKRNGEFYFPEEMDAQLVDWIEEYLYDNIPEKHKVM